MMNDLRRESYVEDLYSVFFHRVSRREEKEHWVSVLGAGMSEREVFERFKASKEYELRTRVGNTFPAGHYYSPIVDPDEARKYLRIDRCIDPSRLGGISISMDDMLNTWEQLRPFLSSTDFPIEREARSRFYENNNIYQIGDAAILRAMIFWLRPKRIIEIGSGFSSACMLDTLDESDLKEVRLTFIEPYPERLRTLLRPSDDIRCEIIEQPVQAVDVSLFTQLEENDILFVDSTHVMKTASDVNCELFELLPRLKAGVVIHFHDVHYPFEYADAWIFEKKYSWNEIYALRAFLMYNYAFEILFFNSLFAMQHRALMSNTCPAMVKNPGGSLWLRKRDRETMQAG